MSELRVQCVSLPSGSFEGRRQVGAGERVGKVRLRVQTSVFPDSCFVRYTITRVISILTSGKARVFYAQHQFSKDEVVLKFPVGPSEFENTKKIHDRLNEAGDPSLYVSK